MSFKVLPEPAVKPPAGITIYRESVNEAYIVWDSKTAYRLRRDGVVEESLFKVPNDQWRPKLFVVPESN